MLNNKNTERFNKVNSLGLNTHIVVCFRDETAHFVCKKITRIYFPIYLFTYLILRLYCVSVCVCTYVFINLFICNLETTWKVKRLLTKKSL